MRHNVAHRKLGRVTEHRIALLRNQAEALLRHERIVTTLPKAKELRPYVERIITLAKRGLKDGAANGRVLTARREVIRDIPAQDVVRKLFDTLAPRYADRPGGYTRILKLGFRRGDSAETAQIELVGSEYNPKAAEPAPDATEKPKTKGFGGRVREAAERLRGKKDDSAAAEKKASRAGQNRAARKSTAPRKMGGS